MCNIIHGYPLATVDFISNYQSVSQWNYRYDQDDLNYIFNNLEAEGYICTEWNRVRVQVGELNTEAITLKPYPNIAFVLMKNTNKIYLITDNGKQCSHVPDFISFDCGSYDFYDVLQPYESFVTQQLEETTLTEVAAPIIKSVAKSTFKGLGSLFKSFSKGKQQEEELLDYEDYDDEVPKGVIPWKKLTDENSIHVKNPHYKEDDDDECWYEGKGYQPLLKPTNYSPQDLNLLSDDEYERVLLEQFPEQRELIYCGEIEEEYEDIDDDYIEVEYEIVD